MDYTQRRQILEELLDHWEDYFALGGSLKGGDGGGDPTISHMAQEPPVVELVRCLETCRRMAPRHYKHLIGQYGAEWRLVDKPIKRRTAHGRWVDDEERVRVRVVPAWVDGRLVDRGLDFLVGIWRYPDKRCELCWDGKRWLEHDGVRECPTHVALELPKQLVRAQKGKLREFVDPVTGETGYTMAA